MFPLLPTRFSYLCLTEVFFVSLTGDKPGMGDFLLWPFLERFLLFQSRVGLDVTQYPAVSAWCAAMKEVPAVKESSYPEEMYLKYFDRYHKDGDPDAQLIGIDQKP